MDLELSLLILFNALIAAGLASFYAFVSYRANKKQLPSIEFNWILAAKTVVPVFIFSFLGGITGLTPETVANVTVSFVLTKILAKVWKA